MAGGAAVVGVGVLAEFVAPLWSSLPLWLHPILTVNEGLILVGGALFGVAALVRRERGRHRGAQPPG